MFLSCYYVITTRLESMYKNNNKHFISLICFILSPCEVLIQGIFLFFLKKKKICHYKDTFFFYNGICIYLYYYWSLFKFMQDTTNLELYYGNSLCSTTYHGNNKFAPTSELEALYILSFLVCLCRVVALVVVFILMADFYDVEPCG